MQLSQLTRHASTQSCPSPLRYDERSRRRREGRVRRRGMRGLSDVPQSMLSQNAETLRRRGRPEFVRSSMASRTALEIQNRALHSTYPSALLRRTYISVWDERQISLLLLVRVQDWWCALDATLENVFMKINNWILAAAISALTLSTAYAQTPLGTQPGMSPAPASGGMQGQGANMQSQGMQGQGMQGGKMMNGDETMARPKKMTHKKMRSHKKMRRPM